MEKFEWKVLLNETEDLFAALLKGRGISANEIPSFLEPDWERDTHDPMLFTQMEPAVNAVFQALKKGEKIVIHGDYDADGVCGSTVLYRCLQEISEKLGYTFNVTAFLPDREKDGYGIAMHTIERFADEDVALLVTVDCGISNIDELEVAHQNDIEVIICDHHQLSESGRVPEQAHIIHPLAPGENYPNKHLCGTGVAFKLASALLDEARKCGADFPIGHEKWYLDLVAIATVTDVMPLLGENRVLEKYGLKVLAKTRRDGIKEIMRQSRTSPDALDTTAIGFRIGPRLNAAGRIDSAEKAFRTLISSGENAQLFADELETLNKQRQKISSASYAQAKNMVKERGDLPIHVVWNEDWNPGVVGLIAGKLVTNFGVPAFALTKVGDHYVGSGRSIGGLHLVEAMRSCGDIFMKAGGHPQACGLSIDSEVKILEFKTKIERFAADFFGGVTPKPLIEIDAELALRKINWDLVNSISKMEPFGQKNPKPVFVSRDVQVISARAIGKTNSHLRLTVNSSDGEILQCIGFGFGKFADVLGMGSMVDIVYELGVNEWNGKRDIQLSLRDLKQHDTI